MLNLVRSARNRLRPVWITLFGIVLRVFPTRNRFRYKFFDIVQFSRSCAPQPCGWRLDYFTTEAVFCQALFFRGFWTFWTWIVLNISVSAGVFERLLVLFKGFVLRLQKSFFCLSAWRSSIIPHLPPLVNTFRQVFSVFFAIHSGVRKSTRFECPPLRAGHLQRQLLLSLQPAQNGPFTRWAVMTGSRCGPVPDFSI